MIAVLSARESLLAGETPFGIFVVEEPPGL
jgi:hypothetical protein